MVHVIQNKDDFEQKITDAGDRLFVIDFCATWCGPCRVVGPMVEELATQYDDKALVVKVDIDDHEDIAMEYKVTCMPTFVFIKNFHVLEVVVGGNAEKLAMSFQKHTAEPEQQAQDQQEETCAPALSQNPNQSLEDYEEEEIPSEQLLKEPPESQQLAEEQDINATLANANECEQLETVPAHQAVP